MKFLLIKPTIDVLPFWATLENTRLRLVLRLWQTDNFEESINEIPVGSSLQVSRYITNGPNNQGINLTDFR